MVIQPAVCKMITGRVFPEPTAQSTPPGQLPATDYVSYFEARAGLQYLAQTYPDWMNVTDVAQSYGLCNSPTLEPPVPNLPSVPCNTARDHFPIMVVEVTNHKSPMPMGDRQQLLFMLSIHGVEKGGREGGLRAIEDMVSNVGIATQTVQNGAGLKEPLAKPSGGGNVETYRDYLDFTRLVFLFPNADGWAHDEIPYVTNQPCGGNGELMCRTNGNNTDLNRQTPTIGWALISAGAGRLPLNEPEPQGYLPYLRDHFHFNYAIDIHGMPNNYILAPIMMSAGSATPQEMLRGTSLAETFKERLNNDPYFTNWEQAWGAQEAVWSAGSPATTMVCSNGGVCDPSVSPLSQPGGTASVGSHLVADWGTVWDSIGYTDSGFSGDFFAQNTGLNAPGYDIEMAYNHLETDSQYEYGNVFNGFHTQIVRHVVKSFMDAAAQDVQVSIETHGTKTLYLKTTAVVTNVDDVDENNNPHHTPGGWADQNPYDDQWQYSDAHPFQATSSKYFSDLQRFLRDGDKPGELVATDGPTLNTEKLGKYDHFVIAGSAWGEINRSADQVAAVKAWVENGGTLVLTDEALKFFDVAGITDKAVDVNLQYAGAINMDRSHVLTKDVRGVARQTYEPVPLGFSIQGNNAPTWYVEATKFASAKGDAAGYAVQGQNGGPIASEVTLGQLSLGKGTIKFIGALLPDPSEEFYHPYGLDDYATTYSGNQILRNMLGWEEVFKAPPIVFGSDGKIIQSSNEAPDGTGPGGAGATGSSSSGKGSPGLELVAALAAVALALAARRRA